MLIYGSNAIKYWFSDFEREPKDIDYISSSEEVKKSNKEIEYYHLPEFDYIFENNKDKKYVDPDFLYTIKISHLSYNINWDKHMQAAMFLKEKGCKLNKELYKSLMFAWKRIHWEKKVKMNVRNDMFFKEEIKRRYDHDWLHEQIAFYERPLNERIRKDLNSPLCSEELWNKLSEEDKFKCSLEELYVLTCERYIFIDKSKPLNYWITIMLKNMITSTTSWWFNLYLKENFLNLIKFDKSYIKSKIDVLLQEKSL